MTTLVYAKSVNGVDRRFSKDGITIEDVTGPNS